MKQKQAKEMEERKRKELAEKIARQTKAKVAASKLRKENEGKGKSNSTGRFLQIWNRVSLSFMREYFIVFVNVWMCRW